MAMSSDCIEWTGSIAPNGYGRVKVKGTTYSAHRLAYERAFGPIPPGCHIDHLCRNRACVNPEHLEAVDPITNIMRGEGVMAQNARKATCPAGHPYEGDNLAVVAGRRRCRECGRARNRAWYARNIEQQRARKRKG